MGNKIRLGFVGAGWWATHNHIPLAAANSDVELAAVCRLGQSDLMEVKETFGFTFATEDYGEMLDKCDLDGVVITTPHHLHYEQASKALEKKAHVMVEKPMTTNAGDARALVSLADSVNRQILIPNGWNFRSYVIKARELIEEGEIGEIKHVSMQMASPAETLFSGQVYPGTEEHMFQPPASTWADPNNFGGYGWGQFPHILGCLFRITDLVPDRVIAVSGGSSTGVDIYDAVIVQFEGGVNATLSGSGTVPMNSKFQVDIRLFGTDGMLLLDMERERLVVRRNDDRNSDIDIPDGDGNYECEEPIRCFIEICEGKDVTNEAPGIVGMHAIQVIDAMYRSIRNGNWENIK